MSFILDAIKKSENERQKNRQPDIHSLQKAGGFRSERSTFFGRILLLLIAVALLTLIVVWIWPRAAEQFGWQIQVVPVESLTDGGDENSSAVHVASPAPTSSAGEVNPATQSTNQGASSQVNASGVSSNELPPRHLIQEFWELPADFQSTVPDMSFSFHVFSKDPSKRTIIINDRSLKEGQTVAAGLKLHVITSTGVILHFRDRYFHIDVVEKW